MTGSDTSRASWTPGPWRWLSGYNDLTAADNRVVLWAGISREGDPELLWADEADARLIAAAPEMAELLDAMLDDMPLGPDYMRHVRLLLSGIRGEA